MILEGQLKEIAVNAVIYKHNTCTYSTKNELFIKELIFNPCLCKDVQRCEK